MRPVTEVETLRHPADVTRRNIPTAETSALMASEGQAATPMLYPRNPDLDPQLVWRGKDEQDSSPLSVETVPIYIQEKVLPEALIRDLQRQSKHGTEPQADLFGGFDRIADAETKLEFYAHAENWSNRMILGDSLLVMNSLAEKEGLRGQVQTIYFDPPYGIRFSSNWQPSTRSRDVKEGKVDSLSREPEQIKAFRDTWKDGVHSYLTNLRDRFSLGCELLAETGSMFVQIGDENVHRIRSLMEEIFGPENFCAQIAFRKTGASTDDFLPSGTDHIVWFAKNRSQAKYHQLYKLRSLGEEGTEEYTSVELADGFQRSARPDELAGLTALPSGARPFRPTTMTSSHHYSLGTEPYKFRGRTFTPGLRYWSTHPTGMLRCEKAGRLIARKQELAYKRFLEDFPVLPITTSWSDTMMSSRGETKTYVVQSSVKVISRCILRTSDPGDLVLDPTCGSGTTALASEHWGRRWITIDTSRVAMALTRTRLTSARHPSFVLRDSGDEQKLKTTVADLDRDFIFDIRQGFDLQRVSHIRLRDIANNPEIDVIHANWSPDIRAALDTLNALMNARFEEWNVLHELPDTASDEIREAHVKFLRKVALRNAEISESIANSADKEPLHDRPNIKEKSVRVTGPFTVESLSPHRVLPTHEDEALLEGMAELSGEPVPPRRHLRAKPDGTDDFVRAVLDNLQKAGVQNTRKNERLTFATLRPWPGQGYVSAEGTYTEGEISRRAAIAIGPEYGTVGQDFVREAARECRDWADALVVCGFAFDPLVGETTMSFGRLAVLKARMSQELHAADAYKAGGGNLFTVFGEPDIALDPQPDGTFIVQLRGVDIFDPTTGEVRTTGNVKDDVACWFIDTDYDADSFFVRHAYFLGGKDPFEKLKSALHAEIDPDAWASLYKTESRPFPKPRSGRIAVKVINHYGDEAMKVFRTP